VQLSTFGRRLQGQEDELPQFEQTVAVSGETHLANVTFNGRRNSRVSGAVIEITVAELAAADQYEKIAAYTPIEVALASGNRHGCTFIRV
jgi:hypothetical protein